MTRMTLSALAVAMAMLAMPVFAQEPDPREIWQQMSPEERKDAVKKIEAERKAKREEWKALSDEDKDAKKAMMKEKWDDLTPEQKAQFHDKRENIRDARENFRDRAEDVRDAQHDGGKRDKIEDIRDKREDVRDHMENRMDRRHGGKAGQRRDK